MLCLKDIRLASNKDNSLILPFSCFLIYVDTFFQFYVDISVIKISSELLTAIFIRVVMLICNTMVFLNDFLFYKMGSKIKRIEAEWEMRNAVLKDFGDLLIDCLSAETVLERR